EAAALPFGWHTAIYFLKKGGIGTFKNPRVLIYGATGSVGTAAVQLARNYNATVTAVCSAAGKELVWVLGAAAIICYGKEDFTKTAERFDVVFDAVGKTSKRQCRHLLKAGGKYVTVGGLAIAAEKKEQLELVCKLFEQGKCVAVIDKIYNFDNIIEAHRYVDTGSKKGNVVVRVNPKF
ncbi:MAG: NAD(P)-dependent alcohol dehydrogenase, partial [Niabella sp.]